MSSRKVREKLREARIARDIALEKSRAARESDLTEQEKKDLTPKKKTAKSKKSAPEKGKKKE